MCQKTGVWFLFCWDTPRYRSQHLKICQSEALIKNFKLFTNDKKKTFFLSEAEKRGLPPRRVLWKRSKARTCLPVGRLEKCYAFSFVPSSLSGYIQFCKKLNLNALKYLSLAACRRRFALLLQFHKPVQRTQL